MNLLSYESSTTTNPLMLVDGRSTHVNVLNSLNLLIQYRKTRLKKLNLIVTVLFHFHGLQAVFTQAHTDISIHIRFEL